MKDSEAPEHRTRLTGQGCVLWAVLYLFYQLFTVPKVPKMSNFLPTRLGRINTPLGRRTNPLPSARLGLAAGRESMAWSCLVWAESRGCGAGGSLECHCWGANNKTKYPPMNVEQSRG